MEICSYIYLKFNNDNRQIPIISRFKKRLQYDVFNKINVSYNTVFYIVLSSMRVCMSLEIYRNNKSLNFYFFQQNDANVQFHSRI